MTETFTFDDILIRPKSSSGVTSRWLTNTQSTLYKHLNFEMPVVSASMSVFDTVENTRDIYFGFAAEIAKQGGMHIFSRATLFSERIRAVRSLSALGLNVGMSVSIEEFNLFKEELVSLPKSSVVSIDIANGAILKDITWGGDYDFEYPTLVIGNFGNPDAVLRRDFLGQIVFKLGIGGGAGCTTRVTTGVGAPQAWLIRESAVQSRKPIISDGGVKTVADFVKSIALGADMVMMGRLLASTVESPWEPVKIGEKWYKPYRGMASKAEKGNPYYVEGDSGFIPFEAKTIKEVMRELRDGLTSAMSYCDSLTLPEFRMKASFLKVTPATVIENGSRLFHSP
jgi:IMP dehydrogenase/GMP reductase